MKRMILALGVLFLLMACERSLFAQTPPSTSTVIGYMDNPLSGWAVDVSNPSASLFVVLEVEVPAGGQRQIGFMQTDFERPDVNAVLMVSGRHGYNLPNLTEICDGKPHVVRAYGLALNDGRRTELPPATPTANQITCGTKAAVLKGTVKNQQGKPITSDSWNMTQVALLKLDDNGFAQPFGQAMVDTLGNFFISQGNNGENLLDGTYELWVMARGYLSDSMSRTRFTYNRTVGLGFSFVLTKAPVFIETDGSTPSIPSNGRYLFLPLRVCNLNFSGGTFGNFAEVYVTTSGAGKTSVYNTTSPQLWYIPVPPDQGTCYQTSLWINIDPTLPDGQYYCANAKVTVEGDPDSVWSEANSCALKGGKENLGNLVAK